MNILYVIGNGFDIAHGYDTSYKAFYKYLNDNREKYSKIHDIFQLTKEKIYLMYKSYNAGEEI